MRTAAIIRLMRENVGRLGACRFTGIIARSRVRFSYYDICLIEMIEALASLT